jgi:crotonobetainyl-CoA:carnitine CoA-transferase CaiB-like acyl-CoA transferase
MSLPLTGLRVIELGQLIAGPFASKILALRNWAITVRQPTKTAIAFQSTAT